MSGPSPERWMRLRHPGGFAPERFDEFCAMCRVFRAYVEASLAEPAIFDFGSPIYVFFEPQLSADRRVASLSLGGQPTIGSRAQFENGSSWMLWHRFPAAFRAELEEGLTEDTGNGLRTNWRKPFEAIWFGPVNPR